MEKNRILVEAESQACCAGCEAAGSCVIGEGGKRFVWLENTLGAGLGNEVTFEIDERAVVLSSFIVYLIPVAALIAGIVFGALKPGIVGLSSELSSIIWGGSSLVLSFGLIRLISNLASRKSLFVPRLLDVARGEIKQ